MRGPKRALEAWPESGFVAKIVSRRERKEPGVRALATKPGEICGLVLVSACLMATSALAGGTYNEITRTTTGGGLERLSTDQIALSATAGQPDAVELQQGNLRLRGGFWPQTLPGGFEETATPTATATSPNETATPSPTLSEPTATSSATPTEPGNPTETATPTGTAPTVVVTVTPSPTPTPDGVRDGDANCDGRVSAADFPALIRAVAGQEDAPCGGDDVNGDGEIDAADLADLAEMVFSE